jgi:hypothetical protein
VRSWLPLIAATLVAAPALGAPSKIYRAEGFSIAAPVSFAVDPNHDYQALGPGKDIRGVAFTIPAALAKGTNLADDSYVAVETLPGSGPCSPGRFLSSSRPLPAARVGRIAYAIAGSSEGAAGNIYDETVYAVKGSSPCLAVRYFIHSLNIGNFDPGAVRAFDRRALTRRFDAIRKTLKLPEASRGTPR